MAGPRERCFYWSMLHHGYGLFDFLSISRILRKAPGKYARSFLYTETDENDLTYFILHQLDAISKPSPNCMIISSAKRRNFRPWSAR